MAHRFEGVYLICSISDRSQILQCSHGNAVARQGATATKLQLLSVTIQPPEVQTGNDCEMTTSQPGGDGHR